MSTHPDMLYIVMNSYDNRGHVETRIFRDTVAPLNFSDRYRDVYYNAFKTLAEAKKYERGCKES